MIPVTDGVITLIAKAITQNEVKAIVETETTREVFCEVDSVGRSDFYQAQQSGLDLSYVFVTDAANYQGERELEYNGERYAVTRTYLRDGDKLEIYAGTAVGLNGAEVVPDGSDSTGQ